MKEFAGKVAGITGAADGIGKAFALDAAKRGMKLALIDIEGHKLEAVKAECVKLGSPKVVAITVDVSEYEQVRMSVVRIMAEFGQIDLFFSNAGVGGAGTLDNIPHQDWDWITSVNFLSMAYYVTEVLPIMVRQGTDAHFMFTISIGGLQPGMRIQSAYTASKHAAMSLAESVKDYTENYAPFIGVTAFCPEYVNTEIWDSERCRPARFQKPYDPFYATSDFLDYKKSFEQRIKTQGSLAPVCSVLLRIIRCTSIPTSIPTRLSATALPALRQTCARMKNWMPSSNTCMAMMTKRLDL